MTTTRQKVFVQTEPSLVGAALGACLAELPGLDVIVSPDRTAMAGATERDVVLVSAPIESAATVFVLSPDQVSIVRRGVLECFPYRDLEQLCALITAPFYRSTYEERVFTRGGAIDADLA